MATPVKIGLSKQQALTNYITLRDHIHHSDKEYGFGVQGRTFVRIKSKDSWLAKRLFDFSKLLHWISCGLLGVNTKQEAVDTLKSDTLKKLEKICPDDASKAIDTTLLLFNKTLGMKAVIGALNEQMDKLKKQITENKSPEEVAALQKQIEELKKNAQDQELKSKEEKSKAQDAYDVKEKEHMALIKQLTELQAKPAATASADAEQVRILQARIAELEKQLKSQKTQNNKEKQEAEIDALLAELDAKDPAEAPAVQQQNKDVIPAIVINPADAAAAVFPEADALTAPAAAPAPVAAPVADALTAPAAAPAPVAAPVADALTAPAAAPAPVAAPVAGALTAPVAAPAPQLPQPEDAPAQANGHAGAPAAAPAPVAAPAAAPASQLPNPEDAPAQANGHAGAPAAAPEAVALTAPAATPATPKQNPDKPLAAPAGLTLTPGPVALAPEAFKNLPNGTPTPGQPIA